MFDSRYVRVFDEVVRTGSFAAAARNLGYTQPAISQQMKALERSVGTPLFMRVGRRLRLTDAGEVLARHASGILGAISAAQQQMTAITRLKSGRVRVYAFPSASATLIPTAVASIKSRHPGIRIELIDAEPPDSVEALRRGDCDITLAFTYDAPSEQPESDDLYTISLLDDPLIVLLPKGHPLARRRSVELAQLAEERWIAGCVRCRSHFIESCATAGFEPHIDFTTDDNLAVQSLVAAGTGIAVMPSMVRSFISHPKVVSRPVLPADSRTVAAYTLSGHQKIPVTRLMMEALQLAADKMRGE
ncbi:LysR family transcriptional regulator [Nocardia iowensis]|uniref:LysR family transcriptional regulator n=1 Tax=Nocardia iowensis TaxID=204891 RepID=A0ABX8RY60_NOCIO|nr:LysR family transcriptional regulator [Nocardia iowensis]QXN94131.1 LysR family transcriptional regulator [Nocardia iowensis]